MNNIIVLIANNNQIDNVKSLFINTINKGNWSFDLCLITNKELSKNDKDEFDGNGIKVIVESDVSPLVLFKPYFKEWDNVVYYDINSYIFHDINDIPSLNHNGKVLLSNENINLSEFFNELWGVDSNFNDLKNKVSKAYNFLNDNIYSTRFISFNTSLIENDTYDKLVSIKNKYFLVSNASSYRINQFIINIYFDKITLNGVFIQDKRDYTHSIISFPPSDTPLINKIVTIKGEDLSDVCNRNIKKFKNNKFKLSNKRLAIIVPYRNREEQLNIFRSYVNYYMKENFSDIDYKIFIVEQTENKPFNRGKLINIGAELAYDYDYFILHDIDMLPISVEYFYSEDVVHLAKNVYEQSNDGYLEYNYVANIDQYAGGVLKLPRDIFYDVNGFDNDYWGWGCEDDELKFRLYYKGYNIINNTNNHFISLKHASNIKTVDTDELFRINDKKSKKTLEEVKNNNYNYLKNGLNTLNYNIINDYDYKNFRKIIVDI